MDDLPSHSMSRQRIRWVCRLTVMGVLSTNSSAMAYGLVQAKTSVAPWRLVFLVESVVSCQPQRTLITANFHLCRVAPDFHTFNSRKSNLPQQTSE